jgi:hypothetical protein
MPGTVPTVNYSPVVDEVVIQQYMRNAWDATKRIRILFQKLDENGAIKGDLSGKYFEWKALVGEFQTAYRGDLVTRTFNRQQHYTTYTAPYSFLEMTHVLSDRDVALSRGREALVQLQNEMLSRMGRDFNKRLNKQILTVNRGAVTTFGQTVYAGTEEPINGLPTIFNMSSTIAGWDPVGQVVTNTTIAATDTEAEPNGTYFNVTTLPNNLPSYVTNPISDATSPVIVNWSSTAFTGNTTWKLNCFEATSRLIQRLTKGADSDEQPDIGIMTIVMYQNIKERLLTVQRIILEESQTNPNAGMFQKKKAIPFETIMLYFDEDMPANLFYCLNTNKIQFRYVPTMPVGSDTTDVFGGKMPSEMFAVTQQHSIEQGAHLVAATLACQVIAEPRYQGAAYNLA